MSLPGHSKWYKKLYFEVQCTCVRNHALKARTSNNFSGDRISEEAASAVTGDEPSTMALAKVDDSNGTEFSDRKVEDSPYDSSARASQQKGLIELEIRDCISASAN